MTHDVWNDRLSEYLDGELAAAERGQMEAHLETCTACREALEDLRLVVAQAGELIDRMPETDLWAGIAERIEPATAVETGRRGWFRASFTFSMPQLAAAAALLVVISGAATWMLTRDSRPGVGQIATRATTPQTTPAPATSATAQATANSIASGAQLADFTRYDATIADLQRVLQDNRADLDTSTVRIIEQNLALIDRAIAEAQRALAADPANPYLTRYLAAQMQRKVRLLHQATNLVAVQQS